MRAAGLEKGNYMYKVPRQAHEDCWTYQIISIPGSSQIRAKFRLIILIGEGCASIPTVAPCLEGS